MRFKRSQQDYPIRVVALDNLRAMCKRESSLHGGEVFEVSDTGPHTVTLHYNHPGVASGFVVLPTWESVWAPDRDHRDPNPRVAFTIIDARECKTYNQEEDEWDEDDVYVCDTVTERLFGSEPLWRSNGDADDWRTRAEWDALKADAPLQDAN